MTRPLFSILVTTYNRSESVTRCLDSCWRQTDDDFEVVVVDDNSTDGTPEVLGAVRDPRLRILRHERNRGISPARASAADHATGQWLVILDSDWELVPEALARLRELIEGRAPEVGIIRSRLRTDSGALQPAIVPDGVTGYRGRLEWCDAVAAHDASSDAGHCIHRSVVEGTPFIADRRGGVETLWELDVARDVDTLWVRDVLGVQHDDAPHSHTRDVDPRRLIPRLREEAPDTLWMIESLLNRHREGLARYAPHYRRSLQRSASRQAFLAGDRRRGMRYGFAAMRSGLFGDLRLWMTIALGLLGPRAMAYAMLIDRRHAGG